MILAGELLSKAENLIDENIHPTLIIDGYNKSHDKAQEVLNNMATPISINDEKALLNVAMTSMGSKGITGAKSTLHASR
jgi:chaperonin GroEL (HSP60 family)